MKDIIRQKIIDSQASSLPAFTPRDVVLPGIPNKAIAIIGMRRTGKTTFLWQILSSRLAQGATRESLLYFNFEDERLYNMQATDLQMVLEEYYLLHPQLRDRHKAVFFFDEIQNVPNWEVFTRRLLDTEEIDLYISGSSAKLLSREVATSMRGRALECLIHPFSFREYLRHHQREPKTDPSRFPKATRSTVEKDLRTYLTMGGFPEAQNASVRDHFALLRSYVDIALLRDVIERHEISNPVALRWLVRQLLTNAARSFSINKFHGDLKSQGVPISKDTLHAYLAHLEDAFLIRTLSIASDSERRKRVNPRKVYPIDTGLIPVFDRSNRANLGHVLETCIMLELERRGADLTYIRTPNGYEVDFLARYPTGKEELIQVCADLADSHTKNREIRSLLETAPEYPNATLHLITLQTENISAIPPNIILHNASTYLLTEPTSS